MLRGLLCHHPSVVPGLASTDVESERNAPRFGGGGILAKCALSTPIPIQTNPGVAALRVARAWRRARSQTGRRRVDDVERSLTYLLYSLLSHERPGPLCGRAATGLQNH